jgi:hypothetical protein
VAELLSELDRVITEAPPTQPNQDEGADACGATTEPASLMKQLAQLEIRDRADMEGERWCAAVDRAVAELVCRGGMVRRTTKP